MGSIWFNMHCETPEGAAVPCWIQLGDLEFWLTPDMIVPHRAVSYLRFLVPF